MSAPRVVVLVEGESDRVALRVLSGRLGRDLAAEGVTILPMGGVTNIGAFASEHGPQGLGRRVIGLYDVAEKHHVRRGLAAAGLPVDPVVGPVAQGFHACDPDLEGELLRALELDAAEAVVDRAGEGRSLRLLAQMPAQRGWSREQLLRRFLGSQSGRKARYAELFTQALDLDRAPRPLLDVLRESAA